MMNRWTIDGLCCLTIFGLALPGQCLAQQVTDATASQVLSEDEWRQVDEAVDRGLDWLARQQLRDGSFETIPTGQPGVTALCVMAFMSHGHLPGHGPYGQQLSKAIDYIMSVQKRNGMLSLLAPNTPTLTRNVAHEIGYTTPYNHAIAGLVLSESYAMEGTRRAAKLRPAIRKALDVTLEMQIWPKRRAVDKGGWRYLDVHEGEDSDLSVTGWQLMFLRSAKNAGFDVPGAPIDRAVEYVLRCFDKSSGGFIYKVEWDKRTTRGMTGAGILALAHAGKHNTPEARRAGDWLLRNRLDVYNSLGPKGDNRYHYSLLTSCQAMFQLGGRHWADFFPPTAKAIVAHQKPNGSWPFESHRRDALFRSAYTTSVCLIALGAPNQLLPVFQR
ncbi:MAG: terpene cyclase/mutase family protein [Pirellulales bacterium]|nr:terpene cyclase/mutase family protein [Pirellulales bacterium]